MNKHLRALFYFLFLVMIGCSDSHQEIGSTSTNTALFDPANAVVPLPNILATATATDPITTSRAANTPMTPPEALAYVNIHEVGSTHAVSGLNAPIYIRFAAPVDPASVTTSTIKVFQITGDSTASTATENNPLTFTDVSALFSYQYAAGSTDFFAYPNFPLSPATRYMYVVTSGVKDAASARPVTSSLYFDALKSPIPLDGALTPLEAIRENVMNGSNIQLSGYAKVMTDLIAPTSGTGITSKNQIVLLGRFITTAAGYIYEDLANAASLVPVESALRSFAAGAALGGLTGKTWTNQVTGVATIPAAAYWAAAGAPGTAPSTLASVVTGNIESADLSVDPVIVRDNAGSANLDSVTGAYNPAAGVVQPFRTGTALTAYYHTSRSIPFVYLVPATPNGKLVIFQHGITGQKEQVLALAQTLTGAGYAVIAIDLPLHGALAVSGHTNGSVWGSDFMAVGAPLATRSNVQQAAFNLDRMELTVKTGGFIAAGITGSLPTEIKYVGISLGSIVGTYYLAGNTTLDPNPAHPPYTQASLNSDMKGFLSVPGGRLAYLLKDSPTFGPSVLAGLAAVGVTSGTPTFNQFFLVTQAIVDPVDPATLTTPLASGLPSRLSGRVVMQEAVGDQVIPNANARYLGNALGGRGVLGGAGAAVAPNFDQLAYLTGTVPAAFMYTLSGATPAPKTATARNWITAGTSPSEGYFQFNQAGIDHGFLLDNVSPTNTARSQLQMLAYLLEGVVVDPTTADLTNPAVLTTLAKPAVKKGAGTGSYHLPPVLKILGY